MKRYSIAALWPVFACAPALSAEYYEIDPERTFSIFEYTYFGLSRQRSGFDRTTGAIAIDHDAKTAHIDIEISSASINTGVEIFNHILRSDNFLDAEKHPAISFKSSRLQFNQEQLVKVEGNLTIKKTTRPVTLQINHYDCRFVISYGKRACAANGFATFLRSEFGMERYVPLISDRVTVYITVEAIQKN